MLTPESITASIAWNPSEGDRLLLAGDENSIATIRTIVATLPHKARGQVFIEVDSVEDIDPILAPGRMMVCWVIRDRGQALSRSIDAWLSEMLPVDGVREHTVYAWIASNGPAGILSSH